MKKQISKLNVYVKLFEEYNKLLLNLKQNQEIIDDPAEDKEMKALAEEEKEGVQDQLEELESQIEEEVIPKKEVDKKNCTVEVRQAAGGSESSLFAEDLVNMYKAYCLKRGFKYIEEEFTSDMAIQRGCKYCIFKVTGEYVYKHFKHESGVHK